MANLVRRPPPAQLPAVHVSMDLLAAEQACRPAVALVTRPRWTSQSFCQSRLASFPSSGLATGKSKNLRKMLSTHPYSPFSQQLFLLQIGWEKVTSLGPNGGAAETGIRQRNTRLRLPGRSFIHELLLSTRVGRR